DRRSDLLLAIDEGTMRSALYQASAHGNRLRLQSADLSQAPLPGSLEINIDEIRVNTTQPPQQLTVRGIRLDYVALPDNNNDTVSFTQDVAISELDTPWPVRSLALHSELSGVDSALTSF